MSPKVNVKSLRSPLWGSHDTNWYAQNYYADFWANYLRFRSALHNYYSKGLSVKVFKAPTKSRLRKAAFAFCSMPASIWGSNFITNPVLYVFPRKGATGKFVPYNTTKSKRRPVSRFKKIMKKVLKKNRLAATICLTEQIKAYKHSIKHLKAPKSINNASAVCCCSVVCFCAAVEQ